MYFVPVGTLGKVGLALVLSYLAAALSNFMSNTTAANILMPLGATLGVEVDPAVVPIALGASAAMCLPISTSPNALAFSSARLATRDFLGLGLLACRKPPIQPR